MNKALSGPVVVGVLVVAVVILVFVGYRVLFSGGPTEKPKLDPMINLLYSPPPQGGANAAPPGR
jgi:hypothetical protein